ncbi:hypothetical protein [Sedimentisphaera salicampi]|uniref:hypothetical protein n=1 Tax=Sedimentisphaera salicampi TaxID=1941349 RepID=UPI000B9C535B|nr:hypothetical protein [Sedimentisphaera salicampi]OXU14736.1 hypothetical protein SMSP1_01509 [Sedimentisphaera salicampi]
MSKFFSKINRIISNYFEWNEKTSWFNIFLSPAVDVILSVAPPLWLSYLYFIEAKPLYMIYLIICIILIAIIKGWFNKLKANLPNRIADDAILALYQSIDEMALSNKLERFAEQSKKYQEQNNICPHLPLDNCIFLNVSKPITQIGKLVDAFSDIFRYIEDTRRTNTKFVVALAKMNGNKVEEIRYFNNKKPLVGEDNEYTPEFLKAKKSKRPFYVPNIRKELKETNYQPKTFNFIEGDPGKGSMAVFPVLCSHSKPTHVPYCVKVYTNKVDFFNKDSIESFEDIFEKIEKRVELEYHLYTILELVSNK